MLSRGLKHGYIQILIYTTYIWFILLWKTKLRSGKKYITPQQVLVVTKHIFSELGKNVNHVFKC